MDISMDIRDLRDMIDRNMNATNLKFWQRLIAARAGIKTKSKYK